MTTPQKRPQAGDRRWVVEWCVKAFVEADGVTGNPDLDMMYSQPFSSHEAALAYAKEIYPRSQRGYVEIEEQVFTMEDDDLYPRWHWEAASEYGEIYEGE